MLFVACPTDDKIFKEQMLIDEGVLDKKIRLLSLLVAETTRFPKNQTDIRTDIYIFTVASLLKRRLDRKKTE